MLRFCSLIVLLAVAAPPAQATEFSGRVGFSDADSLKVGSVTVRLFGIDAPELDQSCKRADGASWRCGRWAATEAKARFDGRTAICTALDRDRYDRIVARCYVGGIDIADVLVRSGIATAYRKYSLEYIDAEKVASIGSIGIWAGTLDAPADHRAATAPAPQLSATGCAIKGNISGSGQIYHMPGQKFYDDTRISPARGERWFCTEAEARAAGWRRARQ